MSRRILSVLAISMFLLGQPSLARAATCSNGRSSTAAMWLSILHPGLGEWHLQGWGSFGKVPQKKFWMGFIPLFGFPYLTVVSAIDTANCRIDDNLNVGAVESGLPAPGASALALAQDR